MKLFKMTSIALASALVCGSSAFAFDVEVNGSVLNQSAVVTNQANLAVGANSTAITRVNSILDAKINGSVVNQAAVVTNQANISIGSGTTACTSFNQIGHDTTCD